MEFSTKNNYIYENLKDEIIEGKLIPGERIVISEVAKRYNVSAMPIREAINRLQQDGFIEVIPHIGASVSTFNIEKYKELMMIRVELEGLAAKLSTEYIDAPTISKLENLINEMEICIENKDNIQYGKLNRQFHMTIYGASPYKILYELIETLWNRSEYSRKVFTLLASRNEESLMEHKAWLEAIKEKNGEKAAQILREQKHNAITLHIEQLEKAQTSK